MESHSSSPSAGKGSLLIDSRRDGVFAHADKHRRIKLMLTPIRRRPKRKLTFAGKRTSIFSNGSDSLNGARRQQVSDFRQGRRMN
jgi:hypothetical protein